MQRGNAYMTVALALCMTLIISLSLTLIEGVRQNAGQLEAECITDVALQSLLAEYHLELMEQYNIFAIDTSYGTAVCGRERVEERLNYYLEKNLTYEDIFLSEYLYRDFLRLDMVEAEVERVSWLVDGNGTVFRRCAIEAVASDTGLDLLEQVCDWMQIIEVNGLESSDVAEQKAQADEQLAEYDGVQIEMQKDVWQTIAIDNPTAVIEEKRRLGILKLVTEEEALSQVAIAMDGLIGNRMEQGLVYRDEGATEESDESLVDKFLFREYLLRYMGHYGKESTKDVLKYQTEYLIAGENSDVENLRKVANRICVIREAANSLYLLGNKEKMGEIRLLARVLCTLILLPEISPLMEAVLLLGWAYAESVYDAKVLLEGGEIPLIKDDDSWHYSLSSALGGDWGEEETEAEGMSYEDYLRVFLMFQNNEELTKRAMNMVEADIRSTEGNEMFRLDACITRLMVDIQFESAYGYEYELIREKGYK